MSASRNRDLDREDGYRELKYDAASLGLLSNSNLETAASKLRSPSTSSPAVSERDDREIERHFERERQLSEFQGDREFILMSIQSALKARRHKEAQEMVFRYRLAAEIDSEFRRLAQLTQTVCAEQRATDELLLVLESTPEDDYAKLCKLYEELLKLEPNHPVYKKAYAKCRRALGLSMQMEEAPKASVGYWIGFILSAMIITSGISSLQFNVVTIIYAVSMLAALFFIFPPQWMRLYRRAPKAFSGSVFLLVNLIIFFAFMFIV